MGIIVVGLVLSFSAYELTTYDSVRAIMGGISAQPNQLVELHSQYDSMPDPLVSAFTYHYGNQAIDITPSQAAGKNEDQIINMVLDKYTTNFYNGNVAGDVATVSGFAGASANGFYFLVTVVLFALFVIIFGLSFLQQWYETTKDMLKSAGKIILVMCVIAFILFLIMPSILESVMWSSINSGVNRDVVFVAEPRASGTILVNTLIMILFGALLYGAGFLIHINTGEGEPDAMEYLRSTPKMQEKKVAGYSPPPGKPGRRQL